MRSLISLRPAGLAWVIALFWLLTFERLLYLNYSFLRLAVQDLFDWRAREGRESWHSRQIREAMLSRLDMAAGAPIPVTKTLVALKFKYKLRVVSGQAIVVYGVVNKMTFKLIDN